MKITYDKWGGFVFEPENGMDEIWLENLIENVYEEDHDKFNEFFTIDLQEGCVLEEKDSQGNHIPAKQIGIKQALEKGEAWGTITRLEFNPFGN